MMYCPVIQCKRITFICFNTQTTSAAAPLFIRHTNSSIVNRICIAIRRIKQVKYLFGKIKPSIFVKILRMIFPDRNLEISLPLSYCFMIGLRCRCKIIWLINSLFVIVNMYLWQPLIVNNHALFAFNLCLPGPITVKIKIVMISSAAWPGFPMFTCIC